MKSENKNNLKMTLHLLTHDVEKIGENVLNKIMFN